MPRDHRVDESRYAMVPRNDVPRSAFDTRYNYKINFLGGYLVPFYVTEILPGDSLRMSVDIFARLAPTIVPPLDDVYMDTFFFFAPNRILWSNWERFMGEQASPADTTAFLIPGVVIDDTAGLAAPDIYNAMGLVNPAAGQSYNANVLPFRAYNQIWNEWFRDQDFDTPVVQNVGDGPDALTDYALLLRRRRPDYFTTARPWPAKPAQSSLSTTLNTNTFLPGLDMAQGWPIAAGRGAGAPVTGLAVVPGNAPGVVGSDAAETGVRLLNYNPEYNTVDDTFVMRAAAAGNFPDVRVLINDIRTANQVQLFMERNARGGTRYAELLRSHFGVISPDARLQRPEYLGGGRGVINIAPIAQTSETAGTQYLGEQAGIGTGIASGHGFTASFTEHGFVIGLVNVRTPMSYERGVHRMWFRRTVFDHYFPAWAHLAEQPILSREIWSDGNTGDETVWGYQERWAEYKQRTSMVRGQFAGWSATPLNFWHFAPFFAARPALNSTFLADDPPLDRVLQVPAYGTEILFDSMIRERWVRAMPMYSIPGLGGRF